MAQNENMQSSLLQDVEITGSIAFKGELTLDGKFNGENIVGNVLIVGKNAVIQGDIAADHLTILGSVRGDVNVAEKCHLTATAKLEGDLKTSRLVMEDGATFIGSSEIAPKPSNVVNLAARKNVAG